MTLNITPKPQIKEQDWGNMLYIEAKGPFDPNAKKAWGEFWNQAGTIDRSQCVHMLGLGHVDPNKSGDDAYTYRAGVIVAQNYKNPFPNLKESKIQGGRYACYTLIGSYEQLPKAIAYGFENVMQSELEMRDDFCIEVYVNSPEDTPTQELQTDLYIPIK